jgi:hypothetical protein
MQSFSQHALYENLQQKTGGQAYFSIIVTFIYFLFLMEYNWRLSAFML